MRKNLLSGTLVTALTFGVFAGCMTHSKAPDLVDPIRTQLDQAGLRDVSVSQDRDKGVVTLTGTTQSDSDKMQAESIAKSVASGEVVADEIAVRPRGDDTAREVDSDQDKGIEKNLDAELARHKLNHDVSYDVKNGVVTLKGKVNSESRRAAVEKMAANVPNVRQVVNELEVRGRRATTTSGS